MAKIILSYIDDEPGCAVYELRDANRVEIPVPEGMESVEMAVKPEEGREYYVNTSGNFFQRNLWKGIARLAGREIPCRKSFAEFTGSDAPVVTPESKKAYDKLACLEKIGGNAWATPDRSKIRSYLNVDVMAKATGLDVNFYNTGNVSSATLDGEKISNAQASKMLSRFNYTKLWYDDGDGKFHFKGEISRDEFKDIVKWIKKTRDGACPGTFD